MAKQYERNAKRTEASQAHANSDQVSSTASMAPPSQMKFETIQQQQAPEEEKLQMKQAPFQLKEEEEKIQMKQAPFQLKEEEEEELQMKQDPFELPEKEEEQ